LKLLNGLLMDYKRNQVEEAISRVLQPQSAKPSSELRTRVKRLLDTDRRLGNPGRSTGRDGTHFAFYSADAPGRGVENWFSGYEAFALLLGLQLMQNGWPQGFAVAVLRQVRPELERQHTRILRQDPASLFANDTILTAARPGDVAVGSIDPVFLVISPSRQKNWETSPVSCATCRGQEQLMRFIRAEGSVGKSWTIFEVTTLVHTLAAELARTEPHHRGRASA
jgi:hypothetical protein